MSVQWVQLLIGSVTEKEQLQIIRSLDVNPCIRQWDLCKVFTLRMKLSSGCRWRSRTACLICFSKSMSRLRGTSSAGNKSPIRPMNTGMSSVTILGMLKSRKALINTYHWKSIKFAINKQCLKSIMSACMWYSSLIMFFSIHSSYVKLLERYLMC